MSDIGRLWAGNIYGTNTGNVFLEFQKSGDAIEGIVRIQDHLFGLSVYEVEGTFDGQTLNLKGNVKNLHEGFAAGEIEVVGTLTENGALRGKWSSTAGTGGTFILHPHDYSEPRSKAGPSPEQLHTAVRHVGAVRLYADDVRRLIDFVSSDFAHNTVTVSYRERGIETNRYAADFLRESEHLGKHRYLRLFIQEPDLYGVSKITVVELTAEGVNEIRVQGAQASWVTGKAESLVAHLRTFEKPLATSFRKFGLNVNGLLLLFVVALIPDLDFRARLAFLAAVVLIAAAVVQVHKKLIPNTIIYLSPRKPSSLSRIWPTVFSWTLAVTSALAAAVVYGLLKGEIPPLW